MKLAKSSVQALDLDELARQIQEAAMSALPKSARPEKPETGDIASEAPESDAESIKGMGATPEKDTAAARSDINYDKALRSIAGGLAHMPRPVIRRAGTMDFATVRGEVKPAPTPAAPTPAAPTPAAPKPAAPKPAAPKPAAPKPAADDLEASIAQALRDEFASSSARAETAPRVEPAPPAAAPAPVNEDEFGHPAEAGDDRHEDMVGFANEGPDYWSDEHEQLQESADLPSADLPSADLPSAAPAPAKRGLASPHALALSAALFLIALGVGGAVAIRVLPLDGLPGIFAGKPVEAPSASSEAKVASSEASAPMTAIAADQPGSDASIPAPSSTAPSPATAPAVPAAASSDLGPTKPSDASSPAAVASAASPAQSATTPIPAPAPAPAPLVTARTANAPAAETPQPAASAPDFGAPRRVATMPAKPEPSANDGSKGDGATPAVPMASASAAADDASQQPEVETAPALPPRRPAELQRTQPSRIVAAAEERKTAKPPRAPAKVAANASTQPPQAQAPAPNAAGQADGQSSGVRGFLHQVFDNQPGAAPNVPPPGASHPVAAARPAQPQAAQPGGTTSIARSEPSAPSGPSVSIKLASSVSEQRAQATLSRLQKQFPGVLAGASVRREDLGKFGVFYRVRVNPMPREAADKVCAQLKASGASCALSGG